MSYILDADVVLGFAIVIVFHNNLILYFYILKQNALTSVPVTTDQCVVQMVILTPMNVRCAVLHVDKI